MDCKAFLERLDAYIDGELAPQEREAFLSHALNCSDCKRELDAAEAIRGALSHLDDGVCVPLAAQAGWRAAVKREAKRRKGRAVYRALSAVAAAFVLLAGTTAVFRATGVLDFDVQTTPTSGVHITTSADKPQYYESLPRESAQSAEPRHALIEADGSASQTATPAQASLSATTVAAGDADSAAVADSANAYGQDETATGAGEASTTQTQLFAKSATREMYAEDFDGAHTSIVNLVEEYNGHVVSDARSGDEGARTATLAVDVPSGELDDFLTALDFVAEVTYQSVNSEDISTNYYDAQGRLETLRLEKDRLNELIAQAQDAEELQALDAQLDDVYAQIDTLESKLRSFDSQLAYARVDIVLREGAQLTATAITGQGGTGGAAKQGLSRSLEAIGAFFSDMGVSLAVIAPYAGIAVLLVAIVWVGVVLVGKHRKRD